MLDLLFRGRHLKFASPLSHEEVTTRLKREVAPAVWRVRETRTQTFVGTFADGRFHMMRLVGGRNSFRPFIAGQVAPAPTGTHIDVQLRLHPIVVIFCTILLVIGGSVTAILASEPAATRAVSPLLVVLLWTAVVAVFAIVAMMETRTATRLLARLFEAEPSRPAAARTS